ESGRTQDGNNNAYCQDNEISWQDWERVDEDLLGYTGRLIALRREHPVLRRRRWFQGLPIRGSVDLGWCKPDGTEMSDGVWDAGVARSVGMLSNAHHDAIDWTLPGQWGQWWEPVLATADPDRETEVFASSVTLPVAGRP